MKINEQRFREMIEEVGMHKFPGIQKRDAAVKLVRMYIWPYLLLRRKEIQREYPQEHQYLQYLLDKSRLDDQQPAEKTQNKPLSDK